MAIQIFKDLPPSFRQLHVMATLSMRIPVAEGSVAPIAGAGTSVADLFVSGLSVTVFASVSSPGRV